MVQDIRLGQVEKISRISFPRRAWSTTVIRFLAQKRSLNARYTSPTFAVGVVLGGQFDVNALSGLRYSLA